MTTAAAGSASSLADHPQSTARGGPRPAPGTINALFFEAVERHDRDDALLHKQLGVWESLSHRTILERVRRAALGLARLGIVAQDRVAILSENRPEWLIADYACLCSAIVTVPIYPTLPAEQIPYLLNDSGARAIFVSTAEQAHKVATIRAEVPTLDLVIGFMATRADGCDYTLAELEALGAQEDSSDRATTFRQAALAVSPDQLLTVIYTSGTTGAPKGVMLTHDNIHANCVAVREALPMGSSDVALSFLPLSHIFERTGDYVLFSAGVRIAYAESIDTVPLNMVEVKPSFLMSVPRLYEKLYARVLENAVAGGGLRSRVFFWAKRVGERWTTERLAGRPVEGLLRLQYALAQVLVFSKLQARTGGNLRYLVSGGAPLSPDIARFFFSAGLPILEGYGLTETSPVITCNTPQQLRIGAVGQPIAGVEIMIAADGEILSRGPHIMRGYLNRPDATSEAIDADGWFHTGDIGVLEDGFLRITDRKKDIIVTAGGKNIAPQPIEVLLQTNAFIAQAVMIGDRRKYPVVLVVPDWDHLEPWAAAQGLVWTSRAELLQLPAIQAKMDAEVAAQLAGLAHFERPKKVALLEHAFSLARGELTPTLKVKRRVVERNYGAVIEGMYLGDA